MGDYIKHWLSVGSKLKNPPKIFHVNWFKVDEENKFMWPGFGDNLRVLEWVLDRSEGKGEAHETPIGYVPKVGGVDLTGLDMSSAMMEKLFAIDPKEWVGELKSQEEFLDKFGDRLPLGIREELESLRKRLGA